MIRAVTRAQLVLAILVAVFVGCGLAFLAGGGRIIRGAGDRVLDTAAGLKKMFRERPAAPRQHVLAPGWPAPPIPLPVAPGQGGESRTLPPRGA
jgi:hypothetical protein